MKKIPRIAVRRFDPDKDFVPLLRLRVSIDQMKSDFTSTVDRLLKQVKLHPEFTSEIFVVLPSIDDEQLPVGVFLIEPLSQHDNTRCVLKGLLIDEMFQNCGIGTQLMRKIPATVLGTFPDTKFIHLAVHPNNTHAIHLYTQAGFVPTHARVSVGNSGRKDDEYVLDLVRSALQDMEEQT